MSPAQALHPHHPRTDSSPPPCRSLLPRAGHQRRIPQAPRALYGRSYQRPSGGRDPRSRGLLGSLPLGLPSDPQGFGSHLLHLRPNFRGQLLPRPEQDPRPLRLSRGESRGVQDQGSPVHHAAPHLHPAGYHQEAWSRRLLSSTVSPNPRSQLRHPPLGIPGPAYHGSTGVTPGRPGPREGTEISPGPLLRQWVQPPPPP